MTSIADSDARFSRARVLPQHQAALTLLQGRLSDPGRARVRWLDLACGRGQMIAFLESNFSADARANLEYYGFDIDQHFVRETDRLASGLKLGAVDVKVGELHDFSSVLPPEALFDFITFTNTVHEVSPRRLASILVDAVLRLSSTGTLFVYDVEIVRPPELGAVPWLHYEMATVVRAILDAFRSEAYRPEVARWQHTTCTAWNLQVQRNHLVPTADEAVALRESAVAKATAVIVELLKAKLESCRRALASLTRHGPETGEEQDEKVRLLHEFWAVSRALESGR